ncbi:MAG: hypothetical protein ABW212_17500 [Pseudonocardia sediminis]
MTTREPARPSEGGTNPEPERPTGVLGRLGAVLALTMCTLFAVVGAVAQPAAGLVTFVVFSMVVIGPLLGVLLHQGGSDRWSATAAGAMGVLAAVGIFLVVSGIVIVFGQASAALLPLVLLAVAAWAWMRRRRLLARVTSAIGSAGTYARARAAGPAHRPTPVPPAVTPPPTMPSPVPSPGDVISTARLCRTWRESYWLLAELPPGPARDEVLERRGLVLDELERRDPVGFGAWLASVPRAGTDPGRYLRCA